jgi:multiple sugar transport system substrate-binding protein
MKGERIMKRKLVALLLIGAMVLAAFAGCGETNAGGDQTPPSSTNPTQSQDPAPAEKEGKVLNIYCWNEEFKSRFTDYYEKAGKLSKDVEVNFIIVPNQGNAYQNALDQALEMQASAPVDEKIDLFLIEADYALKYVNTDYTLDVKADVGLTDADLADQYQYTKDIVTDSNGKQKGTTWQATPGLFAYRRSIAKDVLGTDDPVKVQEALSDWDKFDEVAEKAAAKGYKMLSGYDDSYRTFSNNVSGPWVDGNKIVIDDSLWRWINQTKEYSDKGYNNRTNVFTPEWSADQGPEGKVFGFFYSTWGINFTLLGNALAVAESEGGKLEVGNGIFGDYAVCEGPAPYYWGGTWICAAAGTDNIPTIKDIMYTLTCDAATMKKITEDTQDYTNNEKAMNELANSDFQSAFLGGQNHIALFAEAAPKIDMSNLSPYDQGLNESLQGAFKDYFDGTVDKDRALETFYTDVIEKYPELTK